MPRTAMDIETRTFNRHIAKFARNASIGGDKVLKKFAFDLLARILRRSPVDTGRSRAGWFVSVEKLGAGAITVTAVQGGRTKSKNYDPQKVEEGRKQGDYRQNLGKFVMNKWVELINGVSYIVFLEYGYSEQAPYGMVRLSIREIRTGKLAKDMGDMVRKEWNKFP